MKLHHFLLPVIVAGSIFVSLTGCEQDQHQFSVERKTENGLPTAVATETLQTEAKVEAIDYDGRSIALQGPDGKTEIFRVSRAVRRLNEIKKGDVVQAKYYMRLAATVRKVNEEPTAMITDTVTPNDESDRPGILCTRKAQIQANVQSIDYDTRVVTLKAATGDIMTLTADKKLENLDKVHVGDQVVFDYTESVSINVK